MSYLCVSCLCIDSLYVYQCTEPMLLSQASNSKINNCTVHKGMVFEALYTVPDTMVYDFTILFKYFVNTVKKHIVHYL